MKIESYTDFNRVELTKEEVQEIFRAYVQSFGYIAKGDMRMSFIPEDGRMNIEIEEKNKS